MGKTKRTFNQGIIRTQSEDYLIKYDKTDRMYALVAELSGYGLLEREIAALFGIDFRRFAELKASDTELSNALTLGNARAIANVTRALYTKCVGYSYDEITETVVTDETDGSVKHTIQTKTKSIPPSDNAIVFYLTNKTDSWKNSSKLSVGPTAPEAVDLSKMTDTELEAYIESLKTSVLNSGDSIDPQ